MTLFTTFSKPVVTLSFSCTSCGFCHVGGEGGLCVDSFHCSALQNPQHHRLCLGRQFENMANHFRKEVKCLLPKTCYKLGAKLYRHDMRAVELVSMTKIDRDLYVKYMDNLKLKLDWVQRDFYRE